MIFQTAVSMDDERTELYRNSCSMTSDLNAEGRFMPLSEWLRGWIPSWSNQIGERSEKRRVAEIIFEELTWQIRNAEERRVEREREEKQRRSGGVDYSWLIMVKPKQYTISEVRRLEIEGLCYQIAPEDCSSIVRLFRRAVLREPSAQELPDILQAVLKSFICERPRVEKTSSLSEWSRWIGNSVMSLWPVHLDKSSSMASFTSSQDIDLDRNSLELSELRPTSV